MVLCVYLTLNTDENGKPLTISTAMVAFNHRVNLQEFKATGRTDLSVTILDNFYGFIFRNQELKRKFRFKIEPNCCG
jgi:hypothetical protein